jgi:hypothetical protein
MQSDIAYSQLGPMPYLCSMQSDIAYSQLGFLSMGQEADYIFTILYQVSMKISHQPCQVFEQHLTRNKYFPAVQV